MSATTVELLGGVSSGMNLRVSSRLPVTSDNLSESPLSCIDQLYSQPGIPSS
jgi:hypothetical protein